MISDVKVLLCFSSIIFLSSCKTDITLFRKISSSQSGLNFINKITENDSINPLDLEFLYNGGGVACGDFNNDGLPDLYFTASMSSNKLFLNRGHLRFTDITGTSKTGGAGRWCSGASVVDINGDGKLDIYVCTTIKTNPDDRKNLLYINEGVSREGVPVFKEMAEEYGLADTSYSVHAAFLDYDNDGDLDVYLLTTKLAKRQSVSFGSNKMEPDNSDVDKLLRNDWNDSLKHPFFTDVSKEAGIVEKGYGLGLSVADINRDGWKDIYVANDFYGSDLLYINNKNGGFSEQARQYFKHTSQNAMGVDIADMNNDGLMDIFTVDMNPEDNYRKKKNLGGNNYFIYQRQMSENILLQYVRNTFQLNMGPVITTNDSIGHPVFSDISFYTGTAETDWSWSILMADADNDGNRDIFITNGYPRDVTDHDFAAFRTSQAKTYSKQQLIDQIPQIKVSNYVFKNDGDLRFENTTSQWGMNERTFSNGAVTVDLDNDGDLDYVVNNINDEALLYENKIRQLNDSSANFLQIQFKGPRGNYFGIGAITEIWYDNGRQQVWENSPYRGYLSSMDTKAFFGLGNTRIVDSVLIYWPGGKREKITNVPVNQLLKTDVQSAAPYSANQTGEIGAVLFKDDTQSSAINYRHNEMDYIDFDRERLIPHKLSDYGPGLAVSDVDGNGLEDIFVGGSGDNPGRFLLQKPDGRFIGRSLPLLTTKDARRPENLGILLFDADNDGDDDLYCASGSNEFAANTRNYQDQFFFNDGLGNFTFDTSSAFPVNFTSKSCVKAADYDQDGDLDLFLGGRCIPGKYPFPASSFIYRNDSKPGLIKFSDVTNEIAPEMTHLGMICDAIWTDFDNDGLIDLIIAGEWMPLTFFKNVGGRFKNVTNLSGIELESGWWNSIVAGDFNNDGLIDYIAGNSGLNSFYRAGKRYPVNVYAKDFDGNGTTESVLTVYLKDQKGRKKEYPAFNRDDIVGQLPGLKKKFLTYKDFGNAVISDLFTNETLKDALKMSATNLASCFIKNRGKGQFEIIPLPAPAQLAPVFGMIAEDFDADGNLDLILTGNDFGNDVTNGRYDALNGLVLKGNGQGGFTPLPISRSGLYIPGNGKAVVKLKSTDNSYLVAASENRGPLRLFRMKQKILKWISLNNNDSYVTITLKKGTTRKEELYFGNSFLSQSSKAIAVNSAIKTIEAIDNKMKRRIIYASE